MYQQSQIATVRSGASKSANDIAAAKEESMRHTLQLKMLIFGVVCFFLTVGCSAVQLLQYRHITRTSDRVQATYDVAIDDSSRLREEVIRLVARIKDIWLRGGKTDSLDAETEIAEQSWQMIAALRARIETDLVLTPAMRDQLRQYDQSIADYRQNYLRTLATFRVESGQADAANADTRADSALKGMGLVASGLLGGFQDELHKATATVRADRQASVETARRVTIAETAILLVIITSAGLWLVRTIGRGVGDVALAASALGHGARDVQVPRQGRTGTARNRIQCDGEGDRHPGPTTRGASTYCRCPHQRDDRTRGVRDCRQRVSGNLWLPLRVDLSHSAG